MPPTRENKPARARWAWVAAAVLACILAILLALLALAPEFGPSGGGRGVLGGGALAAAGGGDGSPLRLQAKASPYSTLRADQAPEVARVFQKHFADPKLIIDATAHIGGDTVHFMTLFPRAAVVAVEVNPATFALLQANLAAAAGAAVPAAGAAAGGAPQVEALLANGVDFLRDTPLRADFVYLDPPWGGPSYWKHKSMHLFLNDAAGKRWDISSVVNTVLRRGVAPTAVLKVPFNFDVRRFAARAAAPIAVCPIGHSSSSESRAAFQLILIGAAAAAMGRKSA